MALVRTAFGVSGFAYTYLHNQGLTPDQISVVQDVIVSFGPPIASYIWSAVDKTQANIVAKAAEILASRDHPDAAAVAQAASDLKSGEH